jgi:hypothetical protein
MECIDCAAPALKLFTVYDRRGLPLQRPYCASCYAIEEYDRLVAQARASLCRISEGVSPASLLRPLIQKLADDLGTLAEETSPRVVA